MRKYKFADGEITGNNQRSPKKHNTNGISLGGAYFSFTNVLLLFILGYLVYLGSFKK